MAGQGQSLKLRGKSAMRKGRVGALSPEHVLNYRSVAAPGAVGTVLFEAEAPCKIVRIRERHATTGGGSSVVKIHRHAAGHVGAPAEAVTTGVTLVSSMAADSTANTWQSGTLETGEGTLAAGDTLMVITPSTYANFLLQVTIVYMGSPVGAE